MIQQIRNKIKPFVMAMSLMGIAASSGSILQSYYPLEDVKHHMVCRFRRAGRRANKKLEKYLKE